MAIYRQLQHSSFGPDEIKVLTDAYEGSGWSSATTRSQRSSQERLSSFASGASGSRSSSWS
jgi:hypothetical protein